MITNKYWTTRLVKSTCRSYKCNFKLNYWVSWFCYCVYITISHIPWYRNIFCITYRQLVFPIPPITTFNALFSYKMITMITDLWPYLMTPREVSLSGWGSRKRRKRRDHGESAGSPAHCCYEALRCEATWRQPCACERDTHTNNRNMDSEQKINNIITTAKMYIQNFRCSPSQTYYYTCTYGIALRLVFLTAFHASCWSIQNIALVLLLTVPC